LSRASHVPVLLGQAVDALAVKPGGAYLDGTVGFGGHAEEILRRSAPDGSLIGIDRDAATLAAAGKRLAGFGPRARLWHGNHADFDTALATAQKFDGMLLDLGISSAQVDDAERGFSFMREGPLDMRMDTSRGETAAQYLTRVPPDELEDVLRDAGEERFAGKLTRLLTSRPWTTTGELAEAVARTIPRRGRSHPATRVFLALRLAVNREMESLRVFLKKAPDHLNAGGRLVVITFHSTEDRIVKRFYARDDAAGMRKIGKSPAIPSWDERKANRRSRSAKLRVFEKML